MELLDFILRILAATAAGSAVGLEREISNKSAGLRTNALVALGAAIYVIISLQVLQDGEGDKGRIIGQIVSGIGFLGAGVILHQGANIHGLTTAATIWCSAALGCLAALAMYPLLAISTIMVLFVNVALKKTDLKKTDQQRDKQQEGKERINSGKED